MDTTFHQKFKSVTHVYNEVIEKVPEQPVESEHKEISPLSKPEIPDMSQAKTIDAWLNQTLSEAENLEIPGIMLKPSHKAPLHRYGIDRQSLLDSRISYGDTERIYRSLFVYSVGFYEMLHKLFDNCQFKNSMLSKVWKVYALLLEYCCKSNYKTLVQ